MDEQHVKLINNNFAPKEGLREDLTCCNEESLSRSPSLSSSPILSKDTLNALKELGDVLKSIHRRMVSEGYEIIDGVVKKVC
jgi:hypothetical protein